MDDRRALERNLLLYEFYRPLRSTPVWIPVFFLYLSASFSVQTVLLLEATYYFSVVVLEVPSGYFSDRVSRVATLRIAALARTLSMTLFVLGRGRVEWIILAELMLAASFAFQSGTDTSLHYDTLVMLGREHEFERKQAFIGRNALLAAAAAAVVGGLLGTIDLRLPYLAVLGLSLIDNLLVMSFAEPARVGAAAGPFREQLTRVGRDLRRAPVVWLFAYVVLELTLAHLPYEFAQPYIAEVLGESAASVDGTPLWTGVLFAGVYFVGALASSATPALRRRFGVVRLLIAVAILQVGLVAAMAAVVHPVVALLLTARSVQSAVSNVVVVTELAPRIDSGRRATFLSVNSLVGRLGFAVALAGLALIAGGDEAVGSTLTRLLTASAVLGALMVGAVAWSGRRLRVSDEFDSSQSPV